MDAPRPRRRARAVPSIPCDAEGPVFREPWEAQAFAMTLALHERRHVHLARMGRDARAKKSSARRPRAIPTPARPIIATGSTRSNGWSPRRASTDAATLARYQHAWDHAADRTPHGEPIELQPQDFHHHDCTQAFA